MDSTVVELGNRVMSNLETLAGKLGVGMDYLWPFLVRKQFSQGIGVLFLLILFGVIAIVALRHKLSDDCDDGEEVAKWAFVAISSILFALTAFLFFIEGIPCLVAPEAQAFIEITKAISGN